MRQLAQQRVLQALQQGSVLTARVPRDSLLVTCTAHVSHELPQLCRLTAREASW